ncbi:hypothetical protein BDZ85DRAFT_34176 [Elsinoe ampelina]|uniref:DUF7924 domain-containing protein n=1 Tax=Elsinoe ampelina TaxID=302913 RepID=A0A6A6G3Z9_9PEZI|nr:hypothetical protein BDZ85DRAFT_34176 [Elsinoe ampelina]
MPPSPPSTTASPGGDHAGRLHKDGGTPLDTRSDSPEHDQSGRVNKRKHTGDDLKVDRPEKKRKPISEQSQADSEPFVDWAEYFEEWPRRISDIETKMDEGNNKRLRSQTSYSQSVRDGDSPAAWTRRHEEKMREAGLVMSEYQTEVKMSRASEDLLTVLLSSHYPLPDGPLLHEGKLLRVLDRIRFCNEARIIRDATPFLVPSPELLSLDDDSGLEHVCEALDAEWLQCATLCGPRPKPDFAVGVAASAFDEDEMKTLRLEHTPFCPTTFPEGMYFPFLICEVKSSDRPIMEAERQAMHGASIAVNSIVQLYRKTSALDQIDRELLAFSVAHNDSNVKVFGHFASIKDGKATFYRHRLYAADIATQSASPDWGKPYRLCRAIYETFLPQHIARIKSALRTLVNRPTSDLISQPELMQDSQPSQSSAQGHGQFKKPSLPSTARLQQENDRLREQLTNSILLQQRQEQYEARMQQENNRLQELLTNSVNSQQRLMEQMREEMRREKEKLREEKEQEKEKLREEKEQMIEQRKELMELLKLSAAR